MTTSASSSTRATRLRHVVISAGPTREPIDPVRFLSNYSTGTMGACVAQEAARRGYRVTLVSGPTEVPPPRGTRVIRVETSHDMQRALSRVMPEADALVMAAAVCDFRPVRVAHRKVPRQGAWTLRLTTTPDIVGTLPRRAGQVIVGFALETHAAMAHAVQKLKRKRLDCVIGQVFNGSGAPFGQRAVQAFVVRASGTVTRLGTVSKPRLARVILDEIEQLWYRGIPLQRDRGGRRTSIVLTAKPTR